jgi:phosphonate transport system ATP-binding protein
MNITPVTHPIGRSVQLATKPADTVLEVRDLHVRRGGHHAVRGVSFAMRRGEFVAVMGRSGAGKTSLLHALTGMAQPSEGEVHWTDLCRGACCAETRHAQDRRAVMFQHYRLVPQLSALTNVLCGRLREHRWWETLFGFSAREKSEAIDRLARLGLAERLHVPAGKLSGGEQQRVAVARALIQNPTILLADEPVASLDAETANEVMQMFHDLNRQLGLTVLCVLHDIEMAERYADRVLLLEQGKLVHDGSSHGLQSVVQHKLQWRTLL